MTDAVADALRRKTPIRIESGGSKSAIGAPCDAPLLDLGGLAGVIDYDPAELVLTVRPGTLLLDVEAMIANEAQRLAFDPFDHGPIFGAAAGAATIGGVVAAAASGSARVSGGGARDHLLGFRAVSGRGEAFVAGAKVVKNVTGYDLPKLAVGSWGRLFAFTELTLKVLPRPQMRTTLVILGLNPEQAIRAMAQAMGSQCDVAAAAHVPSFDSMPGWTALRLQGFDSSVTARRDMLARLLHEHGFVEILNETQADDFWAGMRSLRMLPADRPLWRIVVPPSRGHVVTSALERHDISWVFDWAGGLIWLAGDCAPPEIRIAAARAGGHAQLIRAPAELRARTAAFQPLDPGVAALEARVRRAFDPHGLFEIGRF